MSKATRYQPQPSGVLRAIACAVPRGPLSRQSRGKALESRQIPISTLEKPIINFRRFAAFATLIVAGACQNEVSTPNQATISTMSLTAPNLGRGWIMRDGVPTEVAFNIVDGRAVFEGDINLGPAKEVARTREDLFRGPEFGSVINDLGKRWPGGVVHYIIASGFPDQQRLFSAMSQIKDSVTGIVFAPRTWEANFVTFSYGSNPNYCGLSDVGQRGGAQTVIITNGCGVASVVHEILHALGFWHEQSRCDRDNYVQILVNNIQNGQASQFTKHCSDGADVGSYDEGSIMHYRKDAYGKVVNGVTLQTILSLRGKDNVMGQATGVSAADIFTINWMYPAFPPVQNAITYPNGVPMLSWSVSKKAVSYSVRFISTYHYYNYTDNTSDVYDYSWEDLGTTTGLSFSDPSHTAGSYRCYLFNSGYDEAYYTYDYEVRANYAVGAQSQSSRQLGIVAPGSC